MVLIPFILFLNFGVLNAQDYTVTLNSDPKTEQGVTFDLSGSASVAYGAYSMSTAGAKTATISISQKIDVKSVYFSWGVNVQGASLEFYNGSTLIKSISWGSTGSTKTVNASNIDKIIMRENGTSASGAGDLQKITFSIAPLSSPPTVTTTSAISIGQSSATLGGNVTADGGVSVTERGIVYSTSSNPTTSDTKVQIGSGTGTFSQSVTGLAEATQYYIRAYAINSQGTSYGSQEIFTTLSGGRGGDSNPPTFDAAPVVSNVSTTFFNLDASIDEAGTIYYVLVADGATAPAASEIKAGTASGGGLAISAGNQAVSSGDFSGTFFISGLSAGTNYDIYVVAQDDEGTPNLQESPMKRDVQTNHNNALYFDADARISGLDGPNPTNFTVEFNIYLDQLAPGGDWQGVYYNSSDDTGFFVDDQNRLVLYVTQTAHYRFETAFSLKSWTHVALTYDNSSKTVVGYLDGQSISVTSQNGASSGTMILPTSNVMMGYGPGNYGDYSLFTGALDNFRIWNDVRTSSEIDTNKDIELTNVDDVNLIRYYDFNQGVGGQSNTSEVSLIDRTGNTSGGSLANFTLSGNVSNWVAFNSLGGNALPTVTTTAISNFDVTSATMGGNVTADGGASVTERGVVYNTTGTPTTADTKVSIGTGTGSFSQSITGLTGGTQYYVRAYAINAEGTSYGAEETFTTTPSPITTTFSGDLDGMTVFKRPQTDNNDYTAQLQPSDFTTVSTEDFNYFIRTITPEVTGNYSIEVTNSSGFDDTFLFLYSSFDPSSSLSNLIIANDDIGDENYWSTWSRINGVELTGGVAYIVVMTSYQSQAIGSVTFEIVGPSSVLVEEVVSQPSVTTAYPSAIGATTATFGGEVTYDGGDIVTERGFVYATNPGPGTSDTKLLEGSGTGAFEKEITGLVPETTYYVRAYAINAEGTGYGNEESFTTTAVPCAPAAGLESFTNNKGTLINSLPSPQSAILECYEFSVLSAGNVTIASDGNDARLSSDGLISEFRIKASDGSEFKLEEFKALIQSSTYQGNMTIMGYKDGVAVPDATATSSVAQFSVVTTDLSSNIAFNNIDEFRLKFDNSTATGLFLIREITTSTAVSNIAPTAAAFTANPSENLIYTFATSDFSYTDGENDPLDHLRVTAVPGSGTLYVDADNNDAFDSGEELSNGDQVTKANLDAGHLQYIQNGSTSSSFTFDVNDGTVYSASTYTATLNMLALPTVTLGISPTSRLESLTTVNVVTATLSNTYGADVTVDLGFTGTATNNTDYLRSGNSIIITSGNTASTIDLTNISDELVEGDETVIVDIVSVSNGTENGTQQATYTITNDDVLTVDFNSATYSGYEGSSESPGSITVVLSVTGANTTGSGDETIDIALDFGDGTAVQGDVNETSPISVTIPGADYTGTATIDVVLDLTGDAMLEADETFEINLMNPSSNTNVGTSLNSSIVTIINDDAAAVTIADISGDENGGEITITATLDNAVQGGFSVDMNSTDGTATTADGDYTAVTSKTLTFAGTAGETQTFTLTPTGDTKLESDETLTISQNNLSTSLGVVITDEATVTITNDDTAAVTIADISGSEDSEEITITARLDHAVQGGFKVEVNSTDGTATTADEDYTAVTSKTLTFAGTAGETQTFTLIPTADTKLEADEILIISQSNLSATSLDVVITDQATVTITNDDAAAVTIADISGDENGGAITITAILDNPVQGGFTVDVSSTDGTATLLDDDYTAVSETLTFAGTAGETQTFTLTPTEDTKLEADETVTISQSNLSATSLDVVITDEATVTITNDDAAAVTVADITLDEDSHEILITATLDHAVQGGFTLALSTKDGTALEADGDYTALINEVFTFNGTAGETQVINLTGTADNKVEADEYLTISLSALSTSLLVDITNEATITLTNDDAAAIVLSSTSANEDDGAITITATLDNPVQAEDGFSVQLSTLDGTARLTDNDYRSSVQTLNFSGEAGQTLHFTVGIVVDKKLEPNETIRVVQSNLTGTLLPVAISSQAVMTIRNDDGAKLTVEDVSASEDSNQITLKAVLDNAVDGGFTVDLISTDGTATIDDNDYTDLAGQTLRFDGIAGEEISFTLIPTIDDKVEMDDALTIGFTNLDATNLEVNIEDKAVVTLLNDDYATVAIATSVAAIENHRDGQFTITSDHPIAHDVALTVTTAGTAVSDEDYQALLPTYVLPAGQTELIIPVKVLNDNWVEMGETVVATLGTIDVPNVIPNTSSEATLLITDDDHLPVITANQSFSIDEDAANGAILGTVVATDADENTSLVNWEITGGNTAGVFAIDPSSGELSILDNGTLDFVMTPSYSLTLTVSDGFNMSQHQTIQVAVLDASIPSAAIAAAVGEVTNLREVSLMVTFSEQISGLAAEDFSLMNAVVKDISTTDNQHFEMIIAAISDGMVMVNLPENKVVDLANNPNTGSNTIQFFGDYTAPGAELSSDASNPSNLETATVLIDFTELVTGLEAADFVLTNAEIIDFSGQDAAYQIKLATTSGMVRVDIPVGAATDAAGNENEAVSISWEVDLSVPTTPSAYIRAEAINTLNQLGIDLQITSDEMDGTFTYVVTSNVDGTTIEGSGVLVNGVADISGLDVSSLPDGPVTIAATLTDNAGNVSAPASTTLIKNTEEEIPQGFSPNGDGVGDTWVIPGIEKSPNNVVSIFNRYGTKVWETVGYNNDTNAWDSNANVSNTFGNSTLPDGDYFYVIRLLNDNSQIKTGFVVLRR